MKKITTNGRSFGTAQSLTRQQLKNVLGGSATPTTKAGITCTGGCGGGDNSPWTAGCKADSLLGCMCSVSNATFDTCKKA